MDEAILKKAANEYQAAHLRAIEGFAHTVAWQIWKEIGSASEDQRFYRFLEKFTDALVDAGI